MGDTTTGPGTHGAAPVSAEQRTVLADLAAWARKELTGNILPYWERYSRDTGGEGFFGEILADNTPVRETDRSIVMVSRHLWAYSAAATFLSDPARLSMANDAYRYLRSRFHDRVHGGFHWTVKRDGRAAVVKKQIYGQAFAIYALAEYARVPFLDDAVRAEALSLALASFDLLERHARERDHGGYLEALAADWTATTDRTLSPVDIDCDKSMNTNLHVLEALTNLYRVSPAAALREAIVSLLDVHARRIAQAGHLGLFFHSDWTRMETKVSYGHDIEASWLMEEAIEVLESAVVDGPASSRESGRTAPSEHAVFAAAKATIAALAETALAEGLDPEAGALEEEAVSSAPGAHRNRHRIWWCQAESLVGFFAAWQRTRDTRFLEAAIGVRDYIERAIVDHSGGEWLWGTDSSDRPITGQPKGGNWKAAYHDGRACMELMRRTASYI
jgi:mannobiose 2-epimerase